MTVSQGMLFGCRVSAASCLPIILVLSLMVNHNVFPVAEAIWLTVPGSGTKCVSEEIHPNVVVLADYHVFDQNNPDHIPTISAKVTSPYGNNLHHNENATTGQFAFTTSEAGNYEACFWKDGNTKEGSELTLGLDWKIGIAAKDWESVARKEKIDVIEVVLMRLQSTVEVILGNLIYLKEREAGLREVSEVMNARVAFFSILSLAVCIMVSIVQVMFLKRYFIKKRLI